VAATPTPAPVTPQMTTPPDKPTFGDVWAFRSFVILFLLTLLIGLTHFLLSAMKYANDK
jgi:hypothetical protein